MGNKTRSVKYARLFDVVCSGDDEREEKAGRGDLLLYRCVPGTLPTCST